MVSPEFLSKRLVPSVTWSAETEETKQFALNKIYFIQKE